MLREIKFYELFKSVEEPVIIIKGGEVVTLEDLFEGARVLIDENNPVAAGRKEISEPAADEEPAADPETVAQPHPKRRSRKEVEEQILKAWNRGERKISEIMKITGCTYTTVRRYIPESAAD